MARSRDPYHDAQLLRDLQIINARTAAELGPLPPGGLPAEPRRKPEPWRPAAPVGQENEAMKIPNMAAAATLGVAAALAACGVDGTPQGVTAESVKREQPQVQSAPESSTPAMQPQSAAPEAPSGDSANSASGDNLEAFLPAGASILSSATGDLNGDGRLDAVIVVDPARADDEFSGNGPARIMMLLTRDTSGALRKAAQNDKVVPCADCGGMFGDPFQFVSVENGVITVVNEGGAGAYWADEFVFKFVPEGDWQLVKATRVVTQRSTNETNRIDLSQKDFGVISFDTFDPRKLKNANLP